MEIFKELYEKEKKIDKELEEIQFKKNKLIQKREELIKKINHAENLVKREETYIKEVG